MRRHDSCAKISAWKSLALGFNGIVLDQIKPMGSICNERSSEQISQMPARRQSSAIGSGTSASIGEAPSIPPRSGGDPTSMTRSGNDRPRSARKSLKYARTGAPGNGMAQVLAQAFFHDGAASLSNGWPGLATTT